MTIHIYPKPLFLRFFAPADRLCPGTFDFEGGSDNSYWATFVHGLKFENGKQVNSFNVYFYLANEISDKMMNTMPQRDAIGGKKTPLDYLGDVFYDLLKSGDIVSKMDEGEKVWFFSKNAAQNIAAYCCNVAAVSISLQMPGFAATPGNIKAQTKFVYRSEALIRCFMPGSQVSFRELHLTTQSTAIYLPACPY